MTIELTLLDDDVDHILLRAVVETHRPVLALATALLPSEEHELELQQARRPPTLADLPQLRAAQQLLPVLRDSGRLTQRSQAVARQLENLGAKVGTDAFPTSGLFAGHQRGVAVITGAPERLCAFALDQGPVRSHEFYVTKRHVLKFLAEMLQQQAQAVDAISVSVSEIRNRAGGGAVYDRFVRLCCFRVKTGSRGRDEVGEFNFYAIIVFMYRAMLTTENEHLRRLLLRRTAFYFPFAHEHLVARATELGPVTDLAPELDWDRKVRRRTS